jgi:hypothetical protein
LESVWSVVSGVVCGALLGPEGTGLGCSRCVSSGLPLVSWVVRTVCCVWVGVGLWGVGWSLLENCIVDAKHL